MKIISRLGLLATFALVSCDDSKTAEKTSTAKDKEIAALREKLDSLNTDLKAEEGDRAKLIARYDVEIDSLKSSVAKLDSKLRTTQVAEPLEEGKVDEAPVSEEVESEDQMSQFDIEKIRRAAVGEVHDKLELNMGRVYHDVRITGVDEIGVRISHRDGVARIDFMNLPTAWKERFHFNIARFVKARKAERTASYQWEKSVDEKMAKIREEKREVATKKRIAELELALAQAKKPAKVVQVAPTKTSTRRSSPFDRYSTVLYPYYGSRSSSLTYCPPVTSTRSGISVPTYRPSPVCPTPRPIVRTPVVRPPVVRPPVIRTNPGYKPH